MPGGPMPIFSYIVMTRLFPEMKKSEAVGMSFHHLAIRDFFKRPTFLKKYSKPLIRLPDIYSRGRSNSYSGVRL